MTKEDAKTYAKLSLQSLKNDKDENTVAWEFYTCVIEALSDEPQGFEDYLKQYLGENDQMIIGKDVYEELKYELETLKNAPPVEPQEWISVKDRLPTESDEYYVSIRYECENKTTFDNVTTCYFWAKEKMWKGSERMIGKILAWQPITEPSPYKGEEE